MWNMGAIDNLLNPEYDKVTDYRKLFRLIGVHIALDVGTRNEDQTGEAHLLLLKRNGRYGLLTIADKYAPKTGLPPVFCMPYQKAVDVFRDKLEKAIIWFDNPEDVIQWFTDNKHHDNPIYLLAPLVYGMFFRDLAEYLKEHISYLN